MKQRCVVCVLFSVCSICLDQAIKITMRNVVAGCVCAVCDRCLRSVVECTASGSRHTDVGSPCMSLVRRACYLVRQTPSGANLEIQLVKIAPQKIQLVNFLISTPSTEYRGVCAGHSRTCYCVLYYSEYSTIDSTVLV